MSRICSECFSPMPFGPRSTTCSPDCERRLRLRRRAALTATVSEAEHTTISPVVLAPLDEWAGIEDEANPCYYCGLPADTVDHVIPRVVLDALASLDDQTYASVVRSRRMTVPACRECNGVAGATFQESLAERAAYVRHRLERRHRRALAMPDWSAGELAQLSPALRTYVVAGLYERDLLRRRLRYRARGLTPVAVPMPVYVTKAEADLLNGRRP